MSHQMLMVIGQNIFPITMNLAALEMQFLIWKENLKYPVKMLILGNIQLSQKSRKATL